MSVVQTTYPNAHGFLVAGQIVDTQNCDVDSMNLTGSTDVRFGYGVHIDSAPRGVAIGGSREVVALLTAAHNTSITTLSVDNESNPYSELGAGQHLSSALKSCTCRQPPLPAAPSHAGSWAARLLPIATTTLSTT